MLIFYHYVDILSSYLVICYFVLHHRISFYLIQKCHYLFCLMFLIFAFSFFHLLFYLVFISLFIFKPVFFVSFLLLSQRIFYRAIYCLIYLISYFAFSSFSPYHFRSHSPHPFRPPLISSLSLSFAFLLLLYFLQLLSNFSIGCTRKGTMARSFAADTGNGEAVFQTEHAGVI